jgi:hypothetical protein
MADEATRAIVAQLEANTEAIRRLAEESREGAALLREQTSALREQGSVLKGQMSVIAGQTSVLKDLRDESRAQRQALLRILDRLDGPEPGSAAS